MSKVEISGNELIIKEFIEVNQPIGKFILCVMEPKQLLAIAAPFRREFDEDKEAFIGIQRNIDRQKIKELRTYIETADACFPNSLIANLDTSFLVSSNENEIRIKIKDEESSENRALFIIDGQHRLLSFEDSYITGSNFNLVVAIFLGLGNEEQAHLFSTINNKQKKLNSSLVQDLNDLFIIETPEKIVHVLTKLFNESSKSPWKDKIKILGKDIMRDGVKVRGIMSQYSFAKEIIKLIYGSTKDYFELRDFLKVHNNDRKKLKGLFKKYPEYDKYVFWKYYASKDDGFMYNSLLYYFNAIKTKFDGWGNNEYITTKTTGYIAFMKFFDLILKNTTELNKLTDSSYFETIFDKIKEKEKIQELKSENYESGVKGQNKLFNDLKESYEACN